MSHYDLHVTSVPDHKARLVVARLIVGADSTTTMQTALEMADKPPILLLQGLTKKNAEQHAAHLESLGIGVVIAEVADSDDAGRPDGVPPSSAAIANAPDLGDIAGISAHNAANRQAHGALPVPPPQTRYSSKHDISRAHVHGHGQGGSGHAFHSHGGGIAIGALEESTRMEEAEEAERKKSRVITVIMAGALLIIGALMFLLPHGNKFAAKRSAATTGERNANPSSAVREITSRVGVSLAPHDTESAATSQNKDRQRGAVNSQQRSQANTYVDSARASSDDLDKRVAFYKMAISFNRYNHSAWHGLLQAYLDLRMKEEALDTEEKMAEIFGSQILSVNSIVNKSFGELSDAYLNDDGVYRVEYRSRKQGRDDITRDIFNMTRAIRTACACRNISIFASTGANSGMIVHTTQETSVHSFSEFVRNATITWLE